jgi:hypothetical protein
MELSPYWIDFTTMVTAAVPTSLDAMRKGTVTARRTGIPWERGHPGRNILCVREARTPRAMLTLRPVLADLKVGATLRIGDYQKFKLIDQFQRSE